MRVFLPTALTMVAFAANSTLNRAALATQSIDAISFGSLRLLAGALMLGVIAAIRQRGLGFLGRVRPVEAASLFVYIYGFSLAYLSLDAGLGALILFGAVQLTMLGGAALAGEATGSRRLSGGLVAFAGLIWLLLPGNDAGSGHLAAMLAMLAAETGWGIYSLSGRAAEDPLAATAANFTFAAVGGLALALLSAGWPGMAAQASVRGAMLAVVSGAVTSGLGYALWYSVLPRLDRTVAGLAQLTVPVIALLGGAVMLREVPGPGALTAAAVVLAGVAFAVTERRA